MTTDIPAADVLADVRKIDPKTAAAQEDMCLDVLPDVTAILAAAAAGETAAVTARAEVLCTFLVNRIAAIRHEHPDVGCEAA